MYEHNMLFCKIFTVHDCPRPSTLTTPNCIACGMAKQNATSQMPIMNLTARDSFDIVCCLKMEKWKKKKKKKKNEREGKKIRIK